MICGKNGFISILHLKYLLEMLSIWNDTVKVMSNIQMIPKECVAERLPQKKNRCAID